jgi:hypothetical protein
MVVFPSWDMKKGFDVILEARAKSTGIVEQSGLWFTFFKDQAQIDAESYRTSSMSGMFENPKYDMMILVREEVNYYEFVINTDEVALESHKVGLTHISKFLFEGESDKFMSELKNYRTKTRNGKLSYMQVKFYGRTVIVEPLNSGKLVRFTVGEKR